jgi:hypothetical protein
LYAYRKLHENKNVLSISDTALAAAGATTAIMSSGPTAAHAIVVKLCPSLKLHRGDGVIICQPKQGGSGGFVCKDGTCRDIGKK